MVNSKNSIASVVKILAIVTYCVGGIAGAIGIIGMSYLNGLILLVGAFISGTMLLGFAEIIRLLHEINQKG